MAMAKKAEAAVEVADAGLGVVQKAQAALIKKLQKALDDGASKAEAKKIVGNAAGGDPKKPGYLQRIKDAESRLIDFVTRQQRTVKGTNPGQPIGRVRKKTDLKGGTDTAPVTGLDRVLGSGKTFKVDPKKQAIKRNTARAIVYGTPLVTVSKSGSSAAKNPDGAVEAARLKAEAAARDKKAKAKADAKKNRARSDAAKAEYEQAKIDGPARRKQFKKDRKGKLFPKFRPFGGVIARALLGDDEKFGGERGAIDFIRTKKKKPTKTADEKAAEAKAEAKAKADKAKAKAKRDQQILDSYKAGDKIRQGLKNGGMAKKPVKKNMGGMMKKKGYSKGGAMKKKGYANGGMAKKGYANGGPAKKTTSKKTASRGKARGVGAAKRGYGKAMR
tara:strand:+ start:36 stop:1199 length:1164 start_codon:yes stop_codon:yes gene_type:complete